MVLWPRWAGSPASEATGHLRDVAVAPDHLSEVTVAPLTLNHHARDHARGGEDHGDASGAAAPPSPARSDATDAYAEVD